MATIARKPIDESRSGVVLYLNGGGKVSGTIVPNPDGGYIFKAPITKTTSTWADNGYIKVINIAMESGTDRDRIFFVQFDLVEAIEGSSEFMNYLFENS